MKDTEYDDDGYVILKRKSLNDLWNDQNANWLNVGAMVFILFGFVFLIIVPWVYGWLNILSRIRFE